jgi:hypothetical protein
MKNFKVEKKDYMVCFELNGVGHCETHQAICVISLVANLSPCVLKAKNFRLIDMASGQFWNSDSLHSYVIHQHLVADCLYDSARYN